MNLWLTTRVSTSRILRLFVLLGKPRLCSITLERLSDFALKGLRPVRSPRLRIFKLITHVLWLDIFLDAGIQILQYFLSLLSFLVNTWGPGFGLFIESWISILITKYIFSLMINLSIHENLGIYRDVILNKLLEVLLSIMWKRFQCVITWTRGIGILVILHGSLIAHVFINMNV